MQLDLGRSGTEDGAETLEIVCPMGVGTGGVLCVSCPDGGKVEVVVPDGVWPGDTFEVSLRDETSEEATAARAAVRAAARRERGANLH